MSTARSVLLLACVAGVGTAAAQSNDELDLSFLEYLGSWQDGDEEWEVVAEWDEAPEEEDQAPDENSNSDKDTMTEEADESNEADED